MIAGLILSIPFMILLWFLIFKFLLKLDKKNLLTSIPAKIEKQDKKFFNNGKEVNLKEKLGLGDDKETPGEGEGEPEETITDTDEYLKKEGEKDGLD